MTPERIAKLRAVLNRRQPDLTVVTDYVHKLRNLSAIIALSEPHRSHPLQFVGHSRDTPQGFESDATRHDDSPPTTLAIIVKECQNQVAHSALTALHSRYNNGYMNWVLLGPLQYR